MIKIKIICICILIGLVSCAKQQQKIKLETKQIYCPKCNGTGTCQMTTSQKIGLAFTTFGTGLLFDEIECEKCKGTGIIEVPILDE